MAWRTGENEVSMARVPRMPGPTTLKAIPSTALNMLKEKISDKQIM